MIVNKYNYGGGGSGSGVTPQDVQAQIDSALTPYWDSAATESAITQSVSGKADAANTEAHIAGFTFPGWNTQGIITGTTGDFYLKEITLNGNATAWLSYSNYITQPKFYAPVSAGTAGDILVSTGDGAPVWSAVTGPDMSGFYTSAQTDEKIASAVTPVANHLAEVEQITASAYTELHDGLMEVSARTMPDMSLYTPTSGFSTINGSAITNGGNIVIQGGGGGDMSAYWTSAETQSAITSVSGNLQSQIDTMDEVVADALNDLNGDLAAVSGSVSSVSGVVSDLINLPEPAVRTTNSIETYPVDPVTRIVSTNQGTYESMRLQGLVDSHTFYIIVNNS